MQIEYETAADGLAKITLAGRMDIEGTLAIELKLASYTSTDKGTFIIEMSGVSFLASMGIRALIITAKSVRTRRGRLVILGADENIALTLQTAGVDGLIPLFTDFESARSAVLCG
jgi:anti-anti-sigma factor